jgi:hypothetical protein
LQHQYAASAWQLRPLPNLSPYPEHHFQIPKFFWCYFVQEESILRSKWQDGAGFTCDDEELNRIFKAGLRTVQLCSHVAFIDCPTREQRAWVGDGVVHQMVHLATNTDWRLVWCYLTLGNSPRSDGILPMSVVGDIEMR